MRNTNITVRPVNDEDRARTDWTTGKPLYDETITHVAEDRIGTTFGGTNELEAVTMAMQYHQPRRRA